MKDSVARWALALYAVAGAFLLGGLGGLGGAAAAGGLGLWGLPGAGFDAAFGVVLAAYLAAPNRKLGFAAVCFLLGAALAWRLVGDEFHPESYRGRGIYERRRPTRPAYRRRPGSETTPPLTTSGGAGESVTRRAGAVPKSGGDVVYSSLIHEASDSVSAS